MVQGHCTLTMNTLWVKHEQQMRYTSNLNKDFTHDSALTLTLNQDHLTPFDKRQFTGTSDVIYDKGDVRHILCYCTAATIPQPLLNPIYRKQMQNFKFNVTFRRSVKEGKKREMKSCKKEKYKRKSAIWIGSSCNIHLK